MAGCRRTAAAVFVGWHALWLDETLVPAMHLLNGASITRAPLPEMVAYFHVELASHDVIFAEGAAPESFRDDDSRRLFENAAEAPAAPAGPAYAPRLEHGAALQAIRDRLARRAGVAAVARPPGAMQGHVERIAGGRCGFRIACAATARARFRRVADGAWLGMAPVPGPPACGRPSGW